MFEALFPMEKAIVEKLTHEAKELYKDPGGTNKEWTRRFKRALCDLSKGEGYKAYCSLQEPESHEWLWDVCWLIEGTKWQQFRGVMLACEMEWNPKDDSLLEDFLKLTVCEASYGLFIFTLPKKEPDEKFKLLMNACPGSRGYRYLAIGVPREKVDNLPYRAWTL